MAVKLAPNPKVFFLDTAFLFSETYDLRRRIRPVGVRYKEIVAEWRDILDSGSDITAHVQQQTQERMG